MSYSLSFSTSLLLLIFVYDKVRLGFFDFVPLREAAEQLSIPRPTLSKIVSSLIAAEILEAKEGKKGGLRLKRAPETFTLLDVFKAVEGNRPIFPLVNPIKAEGKRPTLAIDGVQGVLDHSQKQLEKDLSSKSFLLFLETLKKAE